jgi:hypothetical protein
MKYQIEIDLDELFYEIKKLVLYELNMDPVQR